MVVHSTAYKLFQIQIVALLVCVTLFVTFAFASSETNLPPTGGEGAAKISGWNVSNVHYRLADNPSKIGAIEFDLDGPANQVAIYFNTASNRAFSCYNTYGHHWLCQVGSIEVANINTLRVIAAS